MVSPTIVPRVCRREVKQTATKLRVQFAKICSDKKSNKYLSTELINTEFSNSKQNKPNLSLQILGLELHKKYKDKSDLPAIDRILGDILKQEKQMDCENFQDLESWCSPRETGEFDMATIDEKGTNTLEIENITHTTKTHINTYPWDRMVSDMDQVREADTVYYPDPHLPAAGPLIWGNPQLDNTDSVISVDKQTYDINNMEIVYEDVVSLPTPSEGTNSFVQSPGYIDSNCNSPTDKCMHWGDVFGTLDTDAFHASEEIHTTHTQHDTLHRNTYETDRMTSPFRYNNKDSDTLIESELVKASGFKEPCNEGIEGLVNGYLLPTRDSFMGNEMIISEIILDDGPKTFSPAPVSAGKLRARDLGLTLDAALMQFNLDSYKFQDVAVTTPDVLRTVELLEADGKFNLMSQPFAGYNKTMSCSPTNDYEDFNLPATFPSTVEDTVTTALHIEDTKQPTESEQSYLVPSPASSEKYCNNNYRKRRLSEDSDVSYEPETQKKQPRKYKKRKLDVKTALTRPTEKTVKKPRGRPPKRRESIISNCTTDDNISCMSTEELKYRELRDKNNEASRRSRMSRKCKEEEMEALAEELDSKNKKLKIRADMLEKLTKRMKDTLMSAILKTS